MAQKKKKILKKKMDYFLRAILSYFYLSNILNLGLLLVAEYSNTLVLLLMLKYTEYFSLLCLFVIKKEEQIQFETI